MDVDWVARGIAIAGFLVAAIGVGAGVVSLRRSITRQRPNLAIDAARWMLVYGLDIRVHYLLVEINISNLSDVSNSILEYGLVLGPPYSTSVQPIHYSETRLGETILEYSPGSRFRPDPLALKDIHLDFLSNPANVPPHESRSGWVGFPLPSVPAEIAKGVPFFLWVIASEGDPMSLRIDLSDPNSEVIRGASPENGDPGAEMRSD